MKKNSDQAFVPPAFDRSRGVKCGIVMPISAIDGLTASHWAEVLEIIKDAVGSIEVPRLVANLVSDADEIGVIHRRIVQNIYSNDIVICDVSGKNPNVMLELGMRLAFDKPVVIVKDDKTEFIFDTGMIEHVGYQRDLRFSNIVDFKNRLAAKIVIQSIEERPVSFCLLEELRGIHYRITQEARCFAGNLGRPFQVGQRALL
jgi:hypothetical protein